jgi:hypothetical protein
LTGGVDFRIASSRAFGEGRGADLQGWWLATRNEGPGGDDEAFGLQARLHTSTWQHRASFASLGEDFEPELGFVRRNGIRTYDWSSEYTWRSSDPRPIRRVRSSFRPEYVTDLEGRKDSWELPLEWLNVEFASEDSIEAGIARSFERIDADFDLGGGATVAAGDYEMTRHEVELRSNDRRVINGAAGVEFGDFFGGEILRWVVEPVLIPGPLFTLTLAYEDIEVDLGDEGFHTNVYAARFDFSFDPRLVWRNLVQYDTESKELGWQSRWHWILTPGQDLFFVAGLGWMRMGDDGSLVPTEQEASVKLQYTLRF